MGGGGGGKKHNGSFNFFVGGGLKMVAKLALNAKNKNGQVTNFNKVVKILLIL